jgi:hypothetical protein
MKTLTGPMWIVLLDAAKRYGCVSQGLYPRGQSRLILEGLYNRGLVEQFESGLWYLTTLGWNVVEEFYKREEEVNEG